MMENQFKTIDNLIENISQNSQLIVKDLVNYHFKECMTYKGRQHSVVYFWNGPLCVADSMMSQIIIQQQFSLNKQMRILKKWEVDFINLHFMNKSNQLIAYSGCQALILDIIESFNLRIFKTILSYGKELLSDVRPLLRMNENEDLIITSVQKSLHFSIKEANGNWKLQQKIEIPHETDLFIKHYLISEQGNILIVSITDYFAFNEENQDATSYDYIFVFLKVDMDWKVIKNIRFIDDNWKYCFLDNGRFAIVGEDCVLNEIKLSVWQVFPETMEAKELQKCKFKMNGQIFNLRFIKQRGLILICSLHGIYAVQQKNCEFYISYKLKISGWAKFLDDRILINHYQIDNSANTTQIQESNIFYED